MEAAADRAEPYRLLFPVGAAFAVAGVLPWFLLFLGLAPWGYPGSLHGRLMVFGFLTAFVNGFLMTAAPRMSGTEEAGGRETAFAFALLCAQGLAGVFGFERVMASILALQVLLLAVFIGGRFRRRTQNPPSMFLFVPFGLVSALTGSLWLAFGDAVASPEIELYAKKLVFEAYLLNLIVGLGSRLVPVLCRVQGALSPDQTGSGSWSRQVVILILLNLSFPLEIFGSREAGLLLRGVLIGYVVLRRFRIFSPVSAKSVLGRLLRTSALMLSLPYLALPVWPGAELHLLHLVYIGGFSLTTLMVAVRVVLAHGGKSLDYELSGRPLIGVAALIAGAALLRAIGPLARPEALYAIAASGAVIWALGMTLWWFAVGRRIDRVFDTLIQESTQKS